MTPPMVAVLVGGASLIALSGALRRIMRPKPMVMRWPALSRDAVSWPQRFAYSVPIEADRADGRWSLMRTDSFGRKAHAGPHYGRRSTALRACRRANAAEALKYFRPSGEG